MTFAFMLAAVPSVVVLLLIPLIARGRPPQRWIGIVLLILPAYLALAGWTQLAAEQLRELLWPHFVAAAQEPVERDAWQCAMLSVN
jgi:hypothetical protein